MSNKTIAFVLYPGLTPLDLIGPLQVMSGLEAASQRRRSAITQTCSPVFSASTQRSGRERRAKMIDRATVNLQCRSLPRANPPLAFAPGRHRRRQLVKERR